MQTSQQRSSSAGFHMLSHQPVQKIQPYCMANFQILDNNLSFALSNQFSGNTEAQFFTLESYTTPGDCAVYDSPSAISISSSRSPFSPQGSSSFLSEPRHSPNNNYASPSGSSVVDDGTELWHKLREVEISLLGPESDIIESGNCCFNNAHRQAHSISSQHWNQILELVPRMDMKQLIILSAQAVSGADLSIAAGLLDLLEKRVSITGEPIERLGAYMLEGLRAKMEHSGSKIYKALRCTTEPTSSELMSYMGVLYNVCPYWKFAYVSANTVIGEAMTNESAIHVIDFQIAQGSQWTSFIHDLAKRPGGPPFLRITGVDDPQSARARGGGLHIVGNRLAEVAASYNVPFQFHDAAMSGCEVEVEALGLQHGYALAVNFPYILHHMPDESVTERNHRDRLLRLMKSLSPKIVTLVEQESNTNTSLFFPRFVETLDYYTAMFESIHVACEKNDKQRISAEQHCVARDVVNMIACEEAERVERHELFTKWKARFTMAGFSPCPMSYSVNNAVMDMLKDYDTSYRVAEQNGAIYLGWKNRAMSTASAWR